LQGKPLLFNRVEEKENQLYPSDAKRGKKKGKKKKRALSYNTEDNSANNRYRGRGLKPPELGGKKKEKKKKEGRRPPSFKLWENYERVCSLDEPGKKKGEHEFFSHNPARKKKKKKKRGKKNGLLLQ